MPRWGICGVGGSVWLGGARCGLVSLYGSEVSGGVFCLVVMIVAIIIKSV